ncbi:MAG: sugar phosphate isomerase/epimerase [Terriglobia bacterium]|jgi:inosose dehydratase
MKEKIPATPENVRAGTSAANSGMTRRGLLRQTAAAALSWAAFARLSSAMPAALPNPVGYSNISWPQEQLGQALQTVSTLGYQGVQVLGWVQETYAGEKTAELKNRLQKLKLSAAALSCSKVKLLPDNPETFTSQFREYADFLHSLGGNVLQLIDGGKPRGNYRTGEIKSLGAKMNELGKMAKDSGMTVGYHPHFGTLGETREGLESVLDATDPRYVGLIADVAHLKLGGSDPAEVIRTYHQRLVLLHLKDVRQDAYELARQNRDAAEKLKFRFCEIGHGVVDFPAVTASLRESQFQGWVIVELDRFEPSAGGPAESARINKDALRSLGFQIG